MLVKASLVLSCRLKGVHDLASLLGGMSLPAKQFCGCSVVLSSWLFAPYLIIMYHIVDLIASSVFAYSLMSVF